MLYKYETTTLEGQREEGTIDAPNLEIAINSLQKRNLIIVSLKPAEGARALLWKQLTIFQRIKTRDVVFLSRQLATLFAAKVPVLESFKLIAQETESPLLAQKLMEIVEDIQGGISMSQAMAKHPNVFSRFYVSMVRSGEESGKLEEVFLFLADYLERSYELGRKAKGALVYPSFVIGFFIIVLILMLVLVIPRLETILLETGGEIPVYTRIVLGTSSFLRTLGPFLLLAIAIGSIFFFRFLKTDKGRLAFSRTQISFPYVGVLYKKLFLARMADNMRTLLSSGISVVRTLEITADVVGNDIYKDILIETSEAIKGGKSLSESLLKFEDMPPIFSSMVRIGEETGKMSFMLETLARFYQREVDSAVENIVSLIEPAMIIILGGAVAILLLAILGPIYNIASGI